jgi:c-di-GMP-binding flagellar brake protein YcgR
MQRERRFSIRAAVDMPLQWYVLGTNTEAPTQHDAVAVDISSFGIAFVSGQEARPGDVVLVRLVHDLPAVDLALPARVVRVQRAVGGYRLAAAFDAIDLHQRAELGMFVIAMIGKRAA